MNEGDVKAVPAEQPMKPPQILQGGTGGDLMLWPWTLCAWRRCEEEDGSEGQQCGSVDAVGSCFLRGNFGRRGNVQEGREGAGLTLVVARTQPSNASSVGGINAASFGLVLIGHPVVGQCVWDEQYSLPFHEYGSWSNAWSSHQQPDVW